MVIRATLPGAGLLFRARKPVCVIVAAAISAPAVLGRCAGERRYDARAALCFVGRVVIQTASSRATATTAVAAAAVSITRISSH